MSPPTKKRPKNKVDSKMQDEKLQDRRKQPVSKLIHRNRLKMVLRNLSLLKLLKSSNQRIQELHSLARRCWNSVLRVPKILRISSGDTSICNKVKQPNEELQEARSLEKKLGSKKVESIGKPEEIGPKKWKSKVESKIRNKAKGSPAAVPQEEEQMELEAPRTSRGYGLNTGVRRRKLHARGPRVVFLKTYHYRTAIGDQKQLDVADQITWFEGLPTRIHLPGPRVMCRSSTLRWVKRCCTRFCYTSLDMPTYHPYKVV